MEAESCKRELLIEIPADVVRKESDNVTAQYAKIARVPGFRPGRAPALVVRQRYREEIRSEVVQNLLPRFFSHAVKDQKLAVVGRPGFDDLKFEDGQPLTFKAVFEVLPEVELKDYKGLEVEEDVVKVADADVDKTLEELRESAATFEVVTDRGAEAGDTANVTYSGREAKDSAGETIDSREVAIDLGAPGTVAAFTENLLGSKPGETREFEVQYPEGYGSKKLAGKTMRYRVEVQSVKRNVLPPLDDELAKTVSEFSTLADLRNKVQEDLEGLRRRQAASSSRRKLVEKLVEAYPVPVPETLLEEQLEQRLESTLRQLISQGIDPRSTELDWRRVREEMRPEAEKEARAFILLDKIAEAEKLDVSEEEIDAVVRDLAQQSKETPAALKTRLTREGGLARLKSSRRNQKALDLIYQSAKIQHKVSSEEQVPGQEAGQIS